MVTYLTYFCLVIVNTWFYLRKVKFFLQNAKSLKNYCIFWSSILVTPFHKNLNFLMQKRRSPEILFAYENMPHFKSFDQIGALAYILCLWSDISFGAFCGSKEVNLPLNRNKLFQKPIETGLLSTILSIVKSEDDFLCKIYIIYMI